MTKPTINLRDLIVLVADGSSYFSMLVHGMLRGFGTSKVIEVRTAVDALRIMGSQHIDVLICDSKLPSNGGHALIRAIRRKSDHDHRTVPILMMSADTREMTVKRARDAGANMVIAKPMSPANLYDRLAWIALTPRKFIDAPNYFGPDRRFKIEGYSGGVGRRKTDRPVEVPPDAAPGLVPGAGAGELGMDGR
jgi:two-component system chemotaxis response regulator CheY